MTALTALADALAALDLPLDRAEPLRDFVGLFHKWNQRINLSAARSEPEIDDHVIDCLHLVPHLRAADLASPRSPPASLLDVGSGGGLPAAIIAICLPAVAVTALEPVHKKHAFLRTAARELGLANFEPLAERLTDHARTDYAAATSRATFDLRDWLTLGLRHVRPSGVVFGFEAVERSDLPPGTQRFPYAHHAKSRAIVALLRPPLSAPTDPARPQ
jgi:16S rRNA (guanine527-N7)-methyltransferase